MCHLSSIFYLKHSLVSTTKLYYFVVNRTKEREEEMNKMREEKKRRSNRPSIESSKSMPSPISSVSETAAESDYESLDSSPQTKASASTTPEPSALYKPTLSAVPVVHASSAINLAETIVALAGI